MDSDTVIKLAVVWVLRHATAFWCEAKSLMIYYGGFANVSALELTVGCKKFDAGYFMVTSYSYLCL